MAYIFKYPTSNAKGIILFTHKELRRLYFFEEKGFVRSFLRLFKKSPFETFRYLNFRGLFLNGWPVLKNTSIVGVHIGENLSNAYYLNHVDFIMADEKNMKDYKGDTPIVNLVSRNFIPETFKDLGLVKYWNIINIDRPHKVNNLDLFFKSIRSIYDKGLKHKVLLFMTSSNDDYDPTSYANGVNIDYDRIFLSAEREHFCLMKLSPDLLFPGFSSSSVDLLINLSKVLTLFCEFEGEPKVLAEAIAAGVKVVSYADLKGGVGGILNDNNAYKFSSFDEADEVLMTVVHNFIISNDEQLNSKRKICSVALIEELKTFLRKLYITHYQKINLELINTDRIQQLIPGHLNEDLPWATFKNATADVLTKPMLEIFLLECFSKVNRA